MMNTEAFEIRILPTSDDGFETHVRSPAGEATSRFVLPFDLQPIEELSQEGTGQEEVFRELRRQQREASSSDPEAIGSQLFRALFTEPIRSLFDASLGHGAAEKKQLPIQFRFDLAKPKERLLARLPWELLYRDDLKQFIGQREATPIVRYLTGRGRSRRFDLPARLRILLITANPTDPELAKLNLAPELEAVRTTWERKAGLHQDNIDFTIIEGCDRQQLKYEIKRHRFHMLHFMGHGFFDFDRQEGGVVLEKNDGTADRLSGQELASWVGDSRTLRFVVLNACNTATAGTSTAADPFAGVAPALVRAGVPGALAMQRPMPDRLAAELGRAFYQYLADGHTVEAALCAARLELYALRPKSEAWSTPVLFSRTPEIFRLPPDIRTTLTRIWTGIGLTLFFVSVNAWLRDRGSPSLPGIDFSNVHHETVVVFGMILGAPLLLLLVYVLIEYQRGLREGGLLYRLPVTFGMPIYARRKVAYLYQIVFLIGFLFIPMGAQGHYYYQFWQHEVWIKKTRETYSQGLEHFTKVPSPLVLLGDDYRYGPKPPEDEHPCQEYCTSSQVNAITFFPFWSPWIFLIMNVFSLGLLSRFCWRVFRDELSSLFDRTAGEP